MTRTTPEQNKAIVLAAFACRRAAARMEGGQ
jgi:hypothetical protein